METRTFDFETYEGERLSPVTVTVFIAGTTTLATWYDVDGDAQTGPVTVDGQLVITAANGEYDLQGVYAGRTSFIRAALFYDPAEGIDIGSIRYVKDNFADLPNADTVVDSALAAIIRDADESLIGIWQEMDDAWVRQAGLPPSYETTAAAQAAASSATASEIAASASTSEAAASEGNAAASESAAATSASLAEVARTQAEIAAISAGAPLFTSTALGLADTIDGNVFMVQQQPGTLVFRNDAGAATFIGWLAEILYNDMVSLTAAVDTGFAPDTLIRTRLEGFCVRVLDGAETDIDLTNAAGVPLRILPVNRSVSPQQWGGDDTGVEDASAAMRAAWIYAAKYGVNMRAVGSFRMQSTVWLLYQDHMIDNGGVPVVYDMSGAVILHDCEDPVFVLAELGNANTRVRPRFYWPDFRWVGSGSPKEVLVVLAWSSLKHHPRAFVGHPEGCIHVYMSNDPARILEYADDTFYRHHPGIASANGLSDAAVTGYLADAGGGTPVEGVKLYLYSTDYTANALYHYTSGAWVEWPANSFSERNSIQSAFSVSIAGRSVGYSLNDYSERNEWHDGMSHSGAGIGLKTDSPSGTASFARTSVGRQNVAGTHQAVMDIGGGFYDSSIDHISGNPGGSTILKLGGAMGGTVIKAIQLEQTGAPAIGYDWSRGFPGNAPVLDLTGVRFAGAGTLFNAGDSGLTWADFGALDGARVRSRSHVEAYELVTAGTRVETPGVLLTSPDVPRTVREQLVYATLDGSDSSTAVPLYWSDGTLVDGMNTLIMGWFECEIGNNAHGNVGSFMAGGGGAGSLNYTTTRELGTAVIQLLRNAAGEIEIRTSAAGFEGLSVKGSLRISS